MALTPLLPWASLCSQQPFRVYLGGGEGLRHTPCSIWGLLGRGLMALTPLLPWASYAHSSHLGFIWEGWEGLRPSIWGLLERGTFFSFLSLWVGFLLLSCLGPPYAHSSYLGFIWGGREGLGFIGEGDILQFSFPLMALTPLLPWASLFSQHIWGEGNV